MECHLSNPRRMSGASMAFVCAVSILFTLLAIAFFYISEIIGGNKQVANATDFGALAAAQQILNVTLTPAQVSQLPQEFAGLGVDPNGNPCPNGTYGNGSPALYNEIACNNITLYAAEIALKAAAIGSQTAIDNANTVIAAANTVAAELSANINNSTNVANAASQFMGANSINILPGFLRTSSNSTTLVPGSLKLAYDTNPNATSGAVLPAAFTSDPTIPVSWINQLLSNVKSSTSGSNYVAAGQVWNFNTITGDTRFTSTLALIPLGTATHLVDPTASYISTTAPGQTSAGPVMPPNVVLLTGQSNASNNTGSGSNGSGNGAPVGGGNNQSLSLNLQVISAAIAGTPGLYTAYIPSTSGSTNPTNPNPQGGAAYFAIINHGDYAAGMDTSGYPVTGQTLGYSGFNFANVDLNASTNIAFDGSNPDIFDLMLLPTNGQIVVGLSFSPYSPDTNYNHITNYGAMPGVYTDVWFDQGYTASPSGPMCQDNYNNAVDSPGLAGTSIPFMMIANSSTATNTVTSNFLKPSTTALTQILEAFQPWIAYNSSKGTDGLNHNPALDPLGSGGSPALFNNNPNAVPPNTTIRATSGSGQLASIADLLQIRDVLVLSDYNMFSYGYADWMMKLLPVVAANYGSPYLPTAVTETKPNGFTALEYLKAQITCLHGGLGLSQSNPVLPSGNDSSLRGINILPAGYCQSLPGLPQLMNVVMSGQRYFQVYDTNGMPVHYAWPEPAGCPKFETPGTPLQLLQNMEILAGHYAQLNSLNSVTPGFVPAVLPGSTNFSTSNLSNGGYADYITSTLFVANDTPGILQYILGVVQKMNAKITMADLTTVLNSQTIDLGQTLYLIYDSTQSQNDGLVMVSTLPNGATYQPADGQVPTGYMAVYALTGNTGIGNVNYYNPSPMDFMKTLVNTAPAPNSFISYNGQLVCPAPYGDNKTQECPFPNAGGQALPNSNAFFFQPFWNNDLAVIYESSGANNNHGELHLAEFILQTAQSLTPSSSSMDP